MSITFGSTFPPQTVECKVYYTAPNEGQEIRFIQLNDEEGDKIKISSNDDLMILINRGNFRVKKLYVTLKGNIPNNLGALIDLSPSSQLNSGPVVHNGVTCDGCQQNPLQGYRYKCLVCPDFDICINCEKSEKIHSHHPMIRFPVPLTSETFYSSEYETIRNNLNGIMQMFT